MNAELFIYNVIVFGTLLDPPLPYPSAKKSFCDPVPIPSLDDDIYVLILTRDRQLRLKPALVQDTDYMVEKTYQLAPCVGTI